jgi:hypothetical protein
MKWYEATYSAVDAEGLLYSCSQYNSSFVTTQYTEKTLMPRADFPES